MFDSIYVKPEMLPLPENIKILFTDDIEFQTKDLGKSLSRFRITPEKTLIEFPYLYRKAEEWEVDFHGIFNFYTSVDEVWYEFKAKFTNGKLEEIIRVEP